MAELWPGGPVTLPHTVTLDGITLTIAEVPATTLLWWLATGSWLMLLPGCCDDEAVLPLLLRIEDEDDPFDLIDLYRPAAVLLGRLSGMGTSTADGYWAARRVAGHALRSWPLYAAWCATRGRDPLAGPLWQIVTAMYGYLRDGLSPEGLEDVERQVWAVPMPTPPAAGGPPSPAAPVPQHLLDQEAASALAALAEAGADMAQEWTPVA